MPTLLRTTTFFVIGDTHYHAENTDNGSPNARQCVAINTLPGKPHPLGGTVPEPDAVIVPGDLVHEDNGDTTTFEADYTLDGSGTVRFPCYIGDGNHDRAQVRSLIIARHGSLTWGEKIGDVFVQMMTENYTDQTDNHPPDPTQIAAVESALLARPANEPKLLLVHRALSGSYPREWVGSDQTYTFGATPYAGTNTPGTVDTDSLTPFLEMIATVPGLLPLVHNHDHYTWKYDLGDVNWPEATAVADHKVWTPGSVAQFPATPPYSTTYPESFLVIRVFRWSDNTYTADAAEYRFGYDVNRVWDPDVWEWTDTWSGGIMNAVASDLHAAAGGAKYSGLISTYKGGSVAEQVIVRGHYDSLAGGGNIDIGLSLIPNATVPAIGAAAGNVAYGRATYATVGANVNVATTGSGYFAAVFEMNSSGTSAGDQIPFPTRHVAVRVANPGTAYTAGRVYIDEVELVD